MQETKETTKVSELEIANGILEFVQNLEDDFDAKRFAMLYMRALAHAGAEFDYKKVLRLLAETDYRFNEVSKIFE